MHSLALRYNLQKGLLVLIIRYIQTSQESGVKKLQRPIFSLWFIHSGPDHKSRADSSQEGFFVWH